MRQNSSLPGTGARQDNRRTSRVFNRILLFLVQPIVYIGFHVYNDNRLIMKYIIANWKANKTYQQVQDWINNFLKNDFDRMDSRVRIILCPPFPYIPFLHEKTISFPFITIGSQDISQFDGSDYTGEVTGGILKDLVEYAIIGHSKRRLDSNETDEILIKKVDHAIKNSIKPIFCIRNVHDMIPKTISLLVYEPVEAIGTGNNEPVNQVLETKKQISLDMPFLYGGSINSINATQYLSHPEINGLMIGGASLDAAEFYKIVKLASEY